MGSGLPVSSSASRMVKECWCRPQVVHSKVQKLEMKSKGMPTVRWQKSRVRPRMWVTFATSISMSLAQDVGYWQCFRSDVPSSMMDKATGYKMPKPVWYMNGIMDALFLFMVAIMLLVHVAMDW